MDSFHSQHLVISKYPLEASRNSWLVSGHSSADEQLLSTSVTLSLDQEMLAHMIGDMEGGGSLASLLLSKDGINGGATAMSNPANKTL